MPDITRRDFLVGSAGLAAYPVTSMPPEPKIPRRKLGKTGMEVSILGLGGGSQFLAACKTDDEAVELVNAAIDGGINYLDSAWTYGNGLSLKRYGLALAKRRKEVYVTSKTDKRDRDAALREVESSLKNLQTDHIDVMQIHSIDPGDDLERILGKDGVYRALLELKEQKVVRAVGITGHLAAAKMQALLERMEALDTILFPINPFKDSRHYIPARDEANVDGHFKQNLLPAAKARGLGIIAMKVTAQGQLIGEGAGKTDAATLIRYAMSAPGVSVAIVGPGSLRNLRQNLETARNFKPMPESERARLSRAISAVPQRFAYHDAAYRDHS